MRVSRGGNHAIDGGAELVTEFGPEESTIDAVLRSIAAAKGVPSTELEPLYDHVDVDALENLIGHAGERECG